MVANAVALNVKYIDRHCCINMTYNLNDFINHNVNVYLFIYLNIILIQNTLFFQTFQYCLKTSKEKIIIFRFSQNKIEITVYTHKLFIILLENLKIA